jgi:hypothetical protein
MELFSAPVKIDREKVFTEEKFAYLPKTLTDGSVIWLEKFEQRCKWEKFYPHGENYILVYRWMKKVISKKRIDK